MSSSRPPRGGKGHRLANAGRPDPLTIQAKRIAAPTEAEESDYALSGSLERYYQRYERGSAAGAHFRLTRALVTAARRWRKVANDRVRSIGQTMARWETLFLVAYSEHDLTQSELASLVSIEGPTMARMLDLLERDGLIVREQSQVDRRMTINQITPAGETVVEEIKAITGKLREEVLRDIDAEDMAVTLRVLSQIILNLDELR